MRGYFSLLDAAHASVNIERQQQWAYYPTGTRAEEKPTHFQTLKITAGGGGGRKEEAELIEQLAGACLPFLKHPHAPLGVSFAQVARCKEAVPGTSGG